MIFADHHAVKAASYYQAKQRLAVEKVLDSADQCEHGVWKDWWCRGCKER